MLNVCAWRGYKCEQWKRLTENCYSGSKCTVQASVCQSIVFAAFQSLICCYPTFVKKVTTLPTFMCAVCGGSSKQIQHTCECGVHIIRILHQKLQRHRANVGEKLAKSQMRLAFHPHFIIFNNYHEVTMEFLHIRYLFESDFIRIYWTKWIKRAGPRGTKLS